MLNKFFANIIKITSKILVPILNGFLFLFEKITVLGDRILVLFAPILILSIIGIFAFPPFLIFLFTPIGIMIVLSVIFIILIPFIGRGGVRFFKKYSEVFEKYFSYKYEQLINDSVEKKTFSYFIQEYDLKLRKAAEERMRREEEERRKYQEAENERWRKFFEENFGSYQGGYNTGSRSDQGAFSSFTTQFENACDVLGVNYNSTFTEIKSAYRKLAKKYHPDLSNEKNAEEMFKKINNAFDFLSEENVNRYNSIKR